MKKETESQFEKKLAELEKEKERYGKITKTDIENGTCLLFVKKERGQRFEYKIHVILLLKIMR